MHYRKNKWFFLHQKLNEPSADSGVDDSLDFLVGAVAEVGEGPARVGQHVGVVVEEQARQNGQTRRHAVEVGRRVFAPTEVAQRPHGVPRHRDATRLSQQPEKRTVFKKCGQLIIEPVFFDPRQFWQTLRSC